MAGVGIEHGPQQRETPSLLLYRNWNRFFSILHYEAANRALECYERGCPSILWFSVRLVNEVMRVSRPMTRRSETKPTQPMNIVLL